MVPESRSFGLVVDGEVVSTSDSFGVIDPATEQIFATAPDCTRAILDRAFESARRAQLTWRVDEDARRTALAALARLLHEHVDDLADVLTREQGKPLADARGEIGAAAAWLDYFSSFEVENEVVQDDLTAFAQVIRKPMGVVAAITPWNYPLAMAAWKLGPALLAGNTVVLKPSPYTPLASLLMGELFQEVLPPGVVSVVSGGNELGAWMTDHEVPRKISITGSVPTGVAVATAAARDLKRVTLELGGNDPAIVLDDMPVEAVADKLFWLAFRNNGQLCAAIKRVYVPRRVAPQLVEALAAIAEEVKIGPGTDPDARLGPINNAPQFDRVARLVEAARQGGAVIAAGGVREHEAGYFYRPTIVGAAHDEMAVVAQEQFGPVLPVVAYDDVEQVISHVNSESIGLCGSVWGEDIDRAARLAASLDCGTTWVNNHAVLAPHLPFGGHKMSGLGVENGRWGYESFTELQVLHRPGRGQTTGRGTK